jgi:hypothetical protein
MNPRGSQYKLGAYQVLLKTNKHKRLLVEGKDDKQFFRLLIHELSRYGKGKLDKIIVDSASDFIDSKHLIDEEDSRKALGNREKVERICNLISGESYASQLIGFVDREFREFDYENLIDQLQVHKIDGRVVWSRGHSIENYLFDRETLSETLKFHLAEAWFENAIDLFDKYFESMILIACSISMSARELEKITKLKDSAINWKMLKLSSGEIYLETDKWTNELTSMKKISINEARIMIEKYELWLRRISCADFNIVRWICHGHIGFNAILALFRFCIARSCPDENIGSPEKYLGNFKNEKHFNFCTNVWLKKVINNQCEHPLEVFRELGFHIV